jgi:DNA replication protein DnaC
VQTRKRPRTTCGSSAKRTQSSMKGEDQEPMLTEPTLEKLKSLRLDAMAVAWTEQVKSADVAKLSFDERLGLLVDAEWIHRENKRMKRLLFEAKLKISGASVEDVDYGGGRDLDRAQIRQLATCRWIEEHTNVVLTGMTGVGKTYIACALAQQACRKGYRALYRRAPRLFHELALARADGTYVRALGKLARFDVLVLDDFGLAPLSDTERNDLLELLDDRSGASSTIVTSQLPPAKWHEYLHDPSIADAICDRVLHIAHRVVLKGPSRRKEKPSRGD